MVVDDDRRGETILRGVPSVLAVGARPWIAPIPGVETASFLTSDDLLGLTDLPASLVIGGAGPIAVEFAQALNRLGVEITLVLRSDAPLRGEEPEARETLLRVLQHEGVRVVTGARRISARDVPGGTELSWIGGSADAEKLLVATGREPRLDESDPAEAGIAFSTAERRSTHIWRPRHVVSGRSATPSAATTGASSSRTWRPTRARRWPRTRCAAHATSPTTWPCRVSRSRTPRSPPSASPRSRRASTASTPTSR